MKITIKRAYEPASVDDGFRVLVDRLWPRGVSKATAHIDLWAKEIAPSSELRAWFHADPEKRFKDFSQKYRKELESASGKNALKKLRSDLRGKKTVTFVTAVKDPEHSHISVLSRYF